MLLSNQNKSKAISFDKIYESTWWKGRPYKVTAPTTGESMNVCIQLFIFYYALEKVFTTILENHQLTNSLYLVKSQTSQYSRFTHPRISSFLKIWKLLKCYTQPFIIKFFSCEVGKNSSKSNSFQLQWQYPTIGRLKNCKITRTNVYLFHEWATVCLCIAHIRRYSPYRYRPMYF